MSKVIGTFTLRDASYIGNIRTLHLNLSIVIEPTGPKQGKAPDYRVMAGECEVGAGWSQTAKSGEKYLNLKLDDPSFLQPLEARLVPAKDKPDTFLLFWERV